MPTCLSINWYMTHNIEKTWWNVGRVLKFQNINVNSSCNLIDQEVDSVGCVHWSTNMKGGDGEGCRQGSHWPLLQQVLCHLYALRRARDGDDAVAGAGQWLRDLDARAALRADLTYARASLAYYRASQLERKSIYHILCSTHL